MRHHTNYCKWIHGVFVLFDHALKTNLKAVCISKYDLAIKMLEWAINNGFPNCIVLADSWFGIGPFIKGLKRLNSIAGKHRIVQSIDPAKQTTKYLLTDQLTWEATKIISVYSHRWVIEEFFRKESLTIPSI